MPIVLAVMARRVAATSARKSAPTCVRGGGGESELFARGLDPFLSPLQDALLPLLLLPLTCTSTFLILKYWQAARAAKGGQTTRVARLSSWAGGAHPSRTLVEGRVRRARHDELGLRDAARRRREVAVRLHR